MLVLPNQSCVVWLDWIKQTGDGIMTDRPRSSTAASTRGCTSQICCAVNYEFTQSPIPINTYLHPINTCCLSANKNRAWRLIHADGTISMLMEAASDVKVRRPTDTRSEPEYVPRTSSSPFPLWTGSPPRCRCCRTAVPLVKAALQEEITRRGHGCGEVSVGSSGNLSKCVKLLLIDALMAGWLPCSWHADLYFIHSLMLK